MDVETNMLSRIGCKWDWVQLHMNVIIYNYNYFRSYKRERKLYNVTSGGPTTQGNFDN